jgi:hypothetical protein
MSIGHFYGVGSYRGSIYLVRDIIFDKDNPRTGWGSLHIDSPDDFAYSLAPGIAGFTPALGLRLHDVLHRRSVVAHPRGPGGGGWGSDVRRRGDPRAERGSWRRV